MNVEWMNERSVWMGGFPTTGCRLRWLKITFVFFFTLLSLSTREIEINSCISRWIATHVYVTSLRRRHSSFDDLTWPHSSWFRSLVWNLTLNFEVKFFGCQHLHSWSITMQRLAATLSTQLCVFIIVRYIMVFFRYRSKTVLNFSTDFPRNGWELCFFWNFWNFSDMMDMLLLFPYTLVVSLSIIWSPTYDVNIECVNIAALLFYLLSNYFHWWCISGEFSCSRNRRLPFITVVDWVVKQIGSINGELCVYRNDKLI
jgi:hypothetical protein